MFLKWRILFLRCKFIFICFTARLNLQMTLNTKRSKSLHIHLYISLRVRNFTPFLSTNTYFRVSCHFETSAPNDSKLTLNTKRSKVPAQNLGSLIHDFKNWNISAWNLAIGKCSRSFTYTLFLFKVVEMKLNFRSTGSGFRDTGPFSKLPYLGMKLGHWPKFQKLHKYRYTLFLPQRVEVELGQRFPRYGPISKIAISEFCFNGRGPVLKFNFVSIAERKNYLYYCIPENPYTLP